MFKVAHSTVKQVVGQHDKLALTRQYTEKLFFNARWSNHTHQLIILSKFNLLPENLVAKHSWDYDAVVWVKGYYYVWKPLLVVLVGSYRHQIIIEDSQLLVGFICERELDSLTNTDSKWCYSDRWLFPFKIGQLTLKIVCYLILLKVNLVCSWLQFRLGQVYWSLSFK